MSTLPGIAIVGRPNVGKSSLMNALVGKRISIVQDMPGVTRDRVTYPFPVNAGTENKPDYRYVELVDTGGYGFIDPDQLTEHIRHQIELAMTRAQLVLFIVDCEVGLTAGDEQIASLLRRQGIKTVLIANKCDGPTADVSLGDFARLGMGTPVGVSAKNVRNLDQVLIAIKRNVDLSAAPKEVPPPEMHIAIVGKRNAGKSTLVNAVARQYEGDPERVIVSEIPGTTRDSVDVRFEKEGKSLVVIDTAGVRKKRHMVTNDIEFYSFHRAQRSIRRADVVLLLIDGAERVSEPDKKLAQYIAEQYKPVILVINKFDLVLQHAEKQAEELGKGFSSESLMDEFEEYLRQELRFLDYAPIAFITAKDSRNIQVLLDLTQKIFKQAHFRLGTSKLNQAVRSILQQKTPSTPSGRRAKIFYATQIETAPPTIVLVVNKPDYLDDSYQRFMINRLRELLPYSEVPIRLLIRPRSQTGAPSGAEGAAMRHAASLEDRTEEEVTEEGEARESKRQSSRASKREPKPRSKRELRRESKRDPEGSPKPEPKKPFAGPWRPRPAPKKAKRAGPRKPKRAVRKPVTNKTSGRGRRR